MALAGASGVVVQASGWAPVNRTAFLEPLPVSVFDNTGTIVNSFGGGAGSIAGLQSGSMVILSGGQLAISGVFVEISGQFVGVASGGTIPVSIVSGNVTINVTLPALQSGEEVVISGGQVALSGLIVEISGSVVNISGESVSISGDVVVIASGFGAISGTAVTISGIFSLSNISGGVQVSGIVQISGYAQIAGSGLTPFIMLSGNIFYISGIVISGAWMPAMAGMVWSSGASQWVPIESARSGRGSINVTLAFADANVTANAISGQVAVLSGGTLPVSIVSGGITISGSVVVSGVVGVSGIVQIASGVIAILSGAISIQSGIISISGGVQVSGTVQVSGIVQVGSGSINVISGMITNFEWPTYSLTAYWSGPQPQGWVGLAHAGGTAAQSGLTLEIIQLELGIWASGNINRVDAYRVNDATVVMSGPAGTIVPFFSGNVLSLASGFVVTSSGIVSGAYSGITALASIFLEANSSGFMHNYTYLFSTHGKMQETIIMSGQGLIIVNLSGIGIGQASVDWIERYLS